MYKIAHVSYIQMSLAYNTELLHSTVSHKEAQPSQRDRATIRSIIPEPDPLVTACQFLK